LARSALLILDREFDGFIIIRHFCSLKQRFVIRLTSKRKFKLAGATSNHWEPTFTREEVAEKHAYLDCKAVITYAKGGVPETRLFLFKAARVQLLAESRSNDPIREDGDTTALTLVEMKIQSDSGWPTLYMLTNAKVDTDLELEKIGRAYLARWNIEEYIRFLKQHYSLEGFLVRDLGRMKNLISGVFIATTIIHILTDRTTLKGWRMHDILIENALEVAPPKKFRDFFLYAYGRGISHIAQANQSLLKPLNTEQKRSDKKSENQLSFPIT
jgi:hypothetical protein